MRHRLHQLARAPRLLLAVDFDGTLAPIVSHPDLARPSPGVMHHLRLAAALPQTCVAVVSGRSLDDLRQRLGPLDPAYLVGGHGAEILGPNLRLAPRDVSLVLESLRAPILAIAPEHLGFFLERKPTAFALHYRNVPDHLALPAVDRLVEEIAKPANLRIRHGKRVLELLIDHADKGAALQALRFAAGASAVAFFGDDVTDEDAFASLEQSDLGVKVGSHPTEAHECVESIEQAHAAIEELVAARRAWLLENARTPIQNYSILSDQRTLAVLSPAGAIEWLCLPRIDAGSIFASLLDSESMGHWSILPLSGESPFSQAYRPDTFTLETRWPSMRVTDYLDASAGRAFQRAGRTDLLRIIEGSGTARIIFAPRWDFARARTKLIPHESGLLVEGAADALVLYAPGVRWSILDADGHHTAVADVALDSGPIHLELRAGTRSLAPPRVPEHERRLHSERVWSQWAASLRLPPIATDLCRRSALILRALFYGPSGAILAAGTTSLPETFGGLRNWDYRFCWPRDAAVAASALVRLGNTGVAMKYLDWLLAIVDRCAGPEKLRPIYSVTADELGAEADLSHLRGYRSSRPVRVGNAAARQVQLDVFGPIVDLVFLLAQAGAAISPDHWRLVEAMATAVERTWHEPDHGIWEIRADKRHHVYSKTMCWLALDRAVRLADDFVGVRRDAWVTLRDRIRDDVLAHGFDPVHNGFVAAYDFKEPDASALAVGLSGLLPPDDPRFLATIDLIERELTVQNSVFRYRYHDALPGPEGGFHLCTGWLIEASLAVGRRQRARELFDSLCAAAGPTGILSEQWCPIEHTGLGNIPQAYSHAALISAAVKLASA